MSFKNNFVKLCYEKGVAPCKAIEEIGFSKASFSKWTDSSLPKPTTIQKIAKYFNCSVSELLADSKPQAAESNEEISDIFEELRSDPNKRLLFSAMQGATAQEIKQAALILETLKKTRQQ